MQLYVTAGLIVGVLQCAGIEGAFTEPFHSSLTQKASVYCGRGSNLTLTFVLESVSDPVAILYVVNSSDVTHTTLTTFASGGMGIDGDGTTNSPYTFSVDADVDNVTSTLSLTMESESKMAYIIGDDVLAIQVMVKSNSSLDGSPYSEAVMFPDDVLYVATCNISEVQDTVVTTGKLNVTGQVTEIPDEISETVTFNILNDQNVTVTEASLGEDMTLNLAITPPTEAKGLYAHTCSVCDKPGCDGNIGVMFVDPSGCPVSYIPPFAARPGAVLSTPPFPIFKFYNTDFMFFRCYVNFCYSPEDPKCNDYCLYNSAGGRKRRSAENKSKDTLTSLLLRIVVSPDGDRVDFTAVDGDSLGNKGQKTDIEKQKNEVENKALLGSVIALAVLSAAGLTLAIVFFYRLSSKIPKV